MGRIFKPDYPPESKLSAPLPDLRKTPSICNSPKGLSLINSLFKETANAIYVDGGYYRKLDKLKAGRWNRGTQY